MKKHACFLLGAVASLGTVFGQTREASPWDNPELPPETKNEIISLLGNSNSPQLAASKPDARQGIRTGKAQPAKLALEKTRPFASKDNARITIKVLIEWPDEFGYQLLLDSDATAYGDVIPENGYFWVEDEGYPDLDELYSEFEYAIPTDAADITGNYNVVLGGQIQHVDIPAGTYDAAVINPVAGTRDILYMAQGEDASLDNYVFEAGKEYVFTVDIDPGREHDNVVLGIKADYDLDVTAISAPTNSRGCRDSLPSAPAARPICRWRKRRHARPNFSVPKSADTTMSAWPASIVCLPVWRKSAKPMRWWPLPAWKAPCRGCWPD